MALLGFSGFDFLGTTITALGTNGWTLGSGASIFSGAGRRGTNSLRIGASTNGHATKTLGANYARLGVGFSFKYATASACGILAFYDGATVQASVLLKADGTLAFYRGTTAGGTLLGTSTVALALNTEYYLELWATFNGTTGSYEIRVDGANVLSGTGLDTTGTANDYVNAFRLGVEGATNTGAGNKDYDDLYWCDDSGASANTFLGGIRVDALAMPTANGNYAEMTPSSGVNHALLIDEMPPNTTDYVDGATSGLRDTFAFGDLAALTSQTIHAVQVKAYALKDDAGARDLGALARLSGTDANAAATASLTTSASYYDFIMTTKPGGGAWTESDVNAAEFGVRVAA